MGRSRYLKRTFCAATGIYFLCCSTFLAYGRFGTDKFFLRHWNYAEPVVEARTSAFGFGPPCLSVNERRCLRAWTDDVRLRAPQSSEYFSPTFMLHDTLCFLCGPREWSAMLRLLSLLPITKVTPYYIELRRERQGEVVFLHGKLETEVTLRIPFAAGAVWECIFPSVVSLQLEPVGPQWLGVQKKYRIAAAEHRWFGGPLASFQSSSLGSLWGDVGDILRRFHGYVMTEAVCAVDDVYLHSSNLIAQFS